MKTIVLYMSDYAAFQSERDEKIPRPNEGERDYPVLSKGRTILNANSGVVVVKATEEQLSTISDWSTIEVIAYDNGNPDFDFIDAAAEAKYDSVWDRETPDLETGVVPASKCYTFA